MGAFKSRNISATISKYNTVGLVIGLGLNEKLDNAIPFPPQVLIDWGSTIETFSKFKKKLFYIYIFIFTNPTINRTTIEIVCIFFNSYKNDSFFQLFIFNSYQLFMTY